MMKKFLALFLALVMMVMIVSCGKSESDSKGDDEVVKSEQPSDTEENNGGEDIPTEPEDNGDEEIGDITFTEQVVIDNEVCLIKITGIDPDDMFGYSLKVYAENKSADKTYTFSVDKAIVDGVDCSALFIQDIEPGKKVNDSVTIMDGDLDGDEKILFTDIEITFSVSDTDDWMAGSVVNETVHIYPYGEDKAVKFERQPKDTDNVILDNEYATVIVTGYEEDEIFGYMANIYIVNKSDLDLMISAEDVSVNDIMMEPYYAVTVPAGAAKFSDMSWATDDFEENGITDVESIEFKMLINDNENWLSDALIEELITINP